MRDDCRKGPEGVPIAGAGMAGGGALVVRPCVPACAAVYAGMPAANRAFAVAQQVLEAG
jgi:hypothetical protein